MILLLSSLLFFHSICSATAADLRVNACGNTSVKYPFGFSSDSPISLTCSDKQIPMIGTFRVIRITHKSIILSVPHSCDRPIAAADTFFSDNYVVTSTTSLILGNCTDRAHLNCSGSMNVTGCSREISSFGCVYNSGVEGFLTDIDNTSVVCSHLVSSKNGTSKGTAQLDWWLDGGCELCSDDTQCRIRTHPVTQKQTVNCKCNQGFVGDGFVAGKGCHKASRRCKASDYLSGKCGSNSRFALLIGGIIVGAVLMAAIALLYCFFKKRAACSQRRNSTRRLLSEACCSIPFYSYKEIERATEAFSAKNRLGTGAYGTVYVGKLHNDSLVAVKKLRNHDGDSMERVMNEIKLLSSVSHPNLVRLLGCCIEREEHVLVYEFMPNGTLAQHLQGEKDVVLPWTVRLNIAADTAKAIAHLHFAIHPPIYHRDIKSSNILLDQNFNSKIADFGLSRMVVTESSHVSTAPQGTPGYVDPEYHQNFHLSDKSDVYSFGVVLVEILTAKKAVDFNRGRSEINLAALAVAKIGKGCVEEILDPYLEPSRDAWTFSSLHKVAELAFRCLAFHRDMRPSMSEVAEELEQIKISGWAPAGRDDAILSATSSLRSYTSRVTDRSKGAPKSGGLLRINSMEDARDDSPVSVQVPWRSEQSSPSADSLLGNALR